MLYMYFDRGAVDYEQSYLLGGLVVISKNNRRRVALISFTAKVAGLANKKSFGTFYIALMV